MSLAACTSLGLPARAGAQTANAVPLEAFFGGSAFSSPRLSPDGTHLAFRVSAAGQYTRLGLLNLATMVPTVVAAVSNSHVGQLQWLSNRRLAFNVGASLDGPGWGYMGNGLFAADIDGEDFRVLMPTTRSLVTAGRDERNILPYGCWPVPGQHPSMGDELLVARFAGTNQGRNHFELRRVNTRTGRHAELDCPPLSARWVFDPQGRLRATMAYDGDEAQLHVAQGDGFKLVARGPRFGPQHLAVPHLALSDGSLIGVAPQGDRTVVVRIDPATGKAQGAPLAQHPHFDMSAMEPVSNGQHLLGLRLHIDAEVTHWLDADAKALQARLDERLPGLVNRISLPRHGDSPFVLVQSTSDVQPTLSHVYDRKADKLTLVGRSQPAIVARQMSPMRFERVNARDGLPLPTYLTVPRASNGKNLPMVVLVHGGPWARGGSWRWSAEVQFLASRGYAVLQTEFRGSTGHGRAHEEASFRQWGRAMQDDLVDAVRWAVQQGVADPQRVAVMGASYGGYATLMALARDADTFRCGVAFAAVTDLHLLATAHWSDAQPAFREHGFPKLIGDPVADAQALKDHSPLNQAERIKAPLLLAHGGFDVRVPIEHGERLRDALKAHNAQLEWVRYDDEGHGLHRSKNLLDFYRRTERFLARHL